MRKNHRLLSLLAVLISILLLISSCTTPTPDPDSAARSSATDRGSGKTGDFSLFGDLSNSAPASSSAPAEGTAAATNAPTPAPTPAPTAAPDYDCHSYAATDGTYIYYFPGDGIHRMDRDGGNDRVVVQKCYEFLSIDAKSLYYLEYDSEYAPVGEELEWQYCLAFNLMRYDLAAQASTAVRKHLYKADAAGGFLYFVDHADHARILSQEISTGTLSDVSGLPAGVEPGSLYIWDEGGKTLFGYWKDDKYYECGVTGNAVGVPVETPMDTGYSSDVDFTAGDGLKLRINYDARTASIWTGSGYSDLGLRDAYTVLESGSAAYVLTRLGSGADSNDKVALKLALFEVRSDGSTKKVFEGSSHTYNGEGSETFELIGDWLFSFWVGGDGGTSSELLLKQQIQ